MGLSLFHNDTYVYAVSPCLSENCHHQLIQPHRVVWRILLHAYRFLDVMIVLHFSLLQLTHTGS